AKSRSTVCPSMVRNFNRRTVCTPSGSSLDLKIQLYDAPVSTSALTSANRLGSAGFQTLTLISKVAMLRHFLHLPKFQFHRSRPPENRDHHLQRLAIFIHVIDHARKRREWTFPNPHRLALLKLNLELRLLPAVRHLINNVIHFFIRQRSRLLPRAHKSRHPRRR